MPAGQVKEEESKEEKPKEEVKQEEEEEEEDVAPKVRKRGEGGGLEGGKTITESCFIMGAH